ncbi:hydrolase [Clostridioides difficile]|nr:hydrolase [Clostridioides difficile]
MSYMPTLEQAWEILRKYNKEEFHIRHAQIVSGVMRYYAKEYDPERVEFWEIVGLLHDLDFEMYPDEHCVKQRELMTELDLDKSIIDSTISHGYGLTGSDVKPEQFMEKVLFAVDELTGLIGAAGCSRDVIRSGAEMLGWELDKLIQTTIEAMRSLIPEMAI